MIESTPIDGCEIVPVKSNADDRGYLFEIFRESWDGAFRSVQWNACVSVANVLRGVHVHAEYDEFYTLPRGRLVVGLADVRRESPTFAKSIQFEWADTDGFAVVVPQGVAHVVHFLEDSVLTFGMNDYWTPEVEDVGCQWDAPELNFSFPPNLKRSERDQTSGGYDQMIADYERIRANITEGQ